jgi:hypothetical protein
VLEAIVLRNLDVVLGIVGSLFLLLILAIEFLDDVFDDGERDCKQCSLFNRSDILHLHDSDS